MCFSSYTVLTYQDLQGSEGKCYSLPTPSTVSLNLIPASPSVLANSHCFLSLNRMCSQANVLPSSIFNIPSPGFFPLPFVLYRCSFILEEVTNNQITAAAITTHTKVCVCIINGLTHQGFILFFS